VCIKGIKKLPLGAHSTEMMGRGGTENPPLL